MELNSLKKDIKPFDWDEIISSYQSKGLFHQSAWLDFIEKSQGGQRVLLKIKENNQTIGYFVGFVLNKGPFKILGSPLPGWHTEFMGPVVNENFNQRSFLEALEKYCKSQKIAQLELSNPVLKPEIMSNHGFQCQRGFTYIVDLYPNKENMWKNLKGTCRTAIRKALKNNLVVEDTNNPEIIDEYYNQLRGVFAKQRLVPTYSRQSCKILFDCLKKQDLLFALRVKYEDKIIATGFFPHDNNCLYFFGGASRQEFQHLRPNDLLHWTAMNMAAERRISKYNMAGRGTFKPKFGGKPTATYHWYKSYNVLAKIARPIYKYQLKIFQRIRGLTERNK